MKTIILPGYSPRNREWAYEVKEKMIGPSEIAEDDISRVSVGNVVVHEWRHWTKGSFNLDFEVKQILKQVSNRHVGRQDNKKEGKISIIAKSVGTSVAMHLIQKVGGSISKLILCGIPINGFGEERKDLFRKNLVLIPPSKVVVFQNEKDNLGSYNKVSEFIHSIDPKIKVVKKPRSDHHYPYPEDFKKFLLTSS